jgi:4-diphosphocytidyl-2-C-methyl-D-erythritol kinase
VEISLPSFAKVNLHLRVLGKRDDGFHDIFTVFQTVSLADQLTFSEADHVSLSCDDPQVPVDSSNLILRAAEALRSRYGVAKGVNIHLNKTIPMGGGLGGGSSNAAVTLIGLDRLWNLNTELEQLAEIARDLGSDVPLFLYGGTMTGSGRGTELEDAREFDREYILIVTPDVQVSTASAYSGIGAQNLTNVESNRILRVCRSEADSPDIYSATLINDFEATVFAAFPEIGRVKQTLLKLGAGQALMSGSGASVFAVFDNQETRQTALKALDNEVNWRKFAVAAISRSEYREKMGITW